MAPDFSLSSHELAPNLIGWELVISDNNGERGGIIIETEAYAAHDPASHSFMGPNTRNAAMFMAPGTIYIYQIYGIHFCMNFVCGNHDGQGVLIRALKPTKGITFMQKQRGKSKLTDLCSGPAKVIQALGITPELDQIHIGDSSLQLTPPTKRYNVKTSPRIGISKATDVLWRFFTSDQ